MKRATFLRRLIAVPAALLAAPAVVRAAPAPGVTMKTVKMPGPPPRGWRIERIGPVDVYWNWP
jgi:hypothetical protein